MLNTLHVAIFRKQGNAFSFPIICRHLHGTRAFILCYYCINWGHFTQNVCRCIIKNTIYTRTGVSLARHVLFSGIIYCPQLKTMVSNLHISHNFKPKNELCMTHYRIICLYWRKIAISWWQMGSWYSWIIDWSTCCKSNLSIITRKINHSTIPHLPGCFCPWTFFENIGFNTVLTDPFVSHLATQLGYSAGEFQALQLIVLAAFGVVD